MDYPSFINSLTQSNPYYEEETPDNKAAINKRTAGDILGSFIRTDIGFNILRSGYGALRYAGILSPFSARINRNLDLFRATTFFMGEGFIAQHTPFGLTGSIARVGLEVARAAGFPLSDRILGTSKTRADLLGRPPKYTMVDKLTIVPKDLNTVVRAITEGTTETIGKDKKLETILLNNLHAMQEQYQGYGIGAPLSTKIKQKLKHIPERVREFVSKDVPQGWAISKPQVTKGTKEAENAIRNLLPKQLRFASNPRLTARVSLGREKASLRLPWKYRLSIGGAWKQREANMMNLALVQSLRDAGLSKEVVEGGTKMIDNYVMRYVNRVGYARFAKLAAAVEFIPGIATYVAGAAFRGAMNVPSAVGKKLRSVVSPEFGRGDIVMNSRMATERQRAAMAIQDSQYNARYLLGNEAAMYHAQ